MDQQPYLAVWVGFMGVLKVAVESYAMQMFVTHPMPLSEKLSSLICSHFLLPVINFVVGFSYVSSLAHRVLDCLLPLSLQICLLHWDYT